MRRTPFRGSAGAVVLAAAALAVTACSEDQTACEAVDSLQLSADQIRQVEAEDEGVAGLAGALLNLSRAAEDAAEAGASRDEVDELQSDIEDLQRALGPSAEGESEAAPALAAVEPQVQSVLEDTDDLLADISDEC